MLFLFVVGTSAICARQTCKASVTGGAHRPWPLTATGIITQATLAGGAAQLAWPRVTNLLSKHTASIAAGQYWRLATPMVLHAGPIHLGVNLLSLSSVGPALEAWYGRHRTLVTYVAGGVAGNIMSCLINPYRSVGASGAIAGLVGALAVHNLRHGRILKGSRENLEAIGRVIVLNAALGLTTTGIDNAGHLGGLLGGAAAAYLIGCRFVPTRDMFGRFRGYKDQPLIAI